METAANHNCILSELKKYCFYNLKEIVMKKQLMATTQQGIVGKLSLNCWL